MPDPLILAGAFHKTGTVLMAKTFRGVAAALGLRFRDAKTADAEPGGFDVGFEPRSRFAAIAGDRAWRGVVCIRDPRDVVISAAHYHCRSDESWLHKPKPNLDGRTYQEAILALPSDEERYLFELRHSAGRTIREMLGFAEPPPEVTLTRMETLVGDVELAEFARVFRFLGVTEAQLPACLAAARSASLFGRAGRRQPERQSIHVRSGGRPEQWREAFTPRVLRAFERLFPDAAERLGYPPSVLAKPSRRVQSTAGAP